MQIQQSIQDFRKMISFWACMHRIDCPPPADEDKQPKIPMRATCGTQIPRFGAWLVQIQHAARDPGPRRRKSTSTSALRERERWYDDGVTAGRTTQCPCDSYSHSFVTRGTVETDELHRCATHRDLHLFPRLLRPPAHSSVVLPLSR